MLCHYVPIILLTFFRTRSACGPVSRYESPDRPLHTVRKLVEADHCCPHIAYLRYVVFTLPAFLGLYLLCDLYDLIDLSIASLFYKYILKEISFMMVILYHFEKSTNWISYHRTNNSQLSQYFGLSFWNTNRHHMQSIHAPYKML